MKYIVSLFMCLFLMASVPTSGQYVKNKKDRAANRAKNKANNKVDQKIDEAVDGAFDKVSSLFKRKKKKKKKKKGNPAPEQNTDRQMSTEDEEKINEAFENSQGNPNSGMFGKAEYDDSYHFNLAITMHIKTVTSSGKTKDESDMTWMLADNKDIFGMKVNDKNKDANLIIFDSKNKTMITVMKKDKKAMAMSMDIGANSDMEDDDDDSNDVKITKTGRTKTILGYRCEEYKMESSEMVGNAWLSTQLGTNSFMNMAKSLNRGKKKKANLYMDQLKGMVLESKQTEKKKRGKTFHMIATNVDKSGKTIHMSDYEVMGFGSN